MKRSILSFLTFVYILFIAFTNAMANGIVILQDSVTVDYDGCIPDQWYSFTACEGDEFNREHILYIDQLAADSSGTISVTFINADLPESVFLIGGNFTEGMSPRIIGRYTPEREGSLLPSALQTISEEAFANSAFSCVVLGSDVTDIQSRAFADCQNLRRIVIPSISVQIAEDSFEGCGPLTIVCPQESTAYEFAVGHGYVAEIIN